MVNYMQSLFGLLKSGISCLLYLHELAVSNLEEFLPSVFCRGALDGSSDQ
jgi:hypothetical protein